ncbi:MAG: energy transducer TonB, partial [Thiovulaceae bacterium]|nr:energy transducer TonB [Sulfurimonadaceae bacterium]
MTHRKNLLLSIGASFFLVFLIFVLISTLIRTTDTFPHVSSSPAFDFIRHQKDSDLEYKNRKRPEKPKPKKELPLPKIKLQQEAIKPQLKIQAFKLPKLSLVNQFKGDLLVGANVGNLSMEVIPLVRISPIYPKRALRMRQEGSVTLSFTINPNGTVRNVKVKSSKPKRIFDAAAIRSLKKWKFKPKLQNGKPVSQQGEQTIVFSLKGEQ